MLHLNLLYARYSCEIFLCLSVLHCCNRKLQMEKVTFSFQLAWTT